MIKHLKIKTVILILGMMYMSCTAYAEGWDYSTGSWKWRDNDGKFATESWHSANGSWFYLDSSGNITKNELIIEETSSGNNIYYVDGNGVLLRNSWKAVAIDPSERPNYETKYWNYYFGPDGKAYTTVGKLTPEQIKTIDGKRYAFDKNGHMLYGWINENTVKQQDYDDDAWEDSDYYFGTWDDGQMREGWQQMKVYVEDDEVYKDYWFYFGTNGKKAKKERKNIDNVNYYFEEDGHMLKSWVENK